MDAPVSWKHLGAKSGGTARAGVSWFPVAWRSYLRANLSRSRASRSIRLSHSTFLHRFDVVLAQRIELLKHVAGHAAACAAR